MRWCVRALKAPRLGLENKITFRSHQHCSHEMRWASCRKQKCVLMSCKLRTLACCPHTVWSYMKSTHQIFSWLLNRKSGSSPTTTAATTWRWVLAPIRTGCRWLSTEFPARSTPSSPPRTSLHPWSRSVFSGRHQTDRCPSTSTETTSPRPAPAPWGTLCRLVASSG